MKKLVMHYVYEVENEWYLMVEEEPSDLDVRFKYQCDGSVYCVEYDMVFLSLESLKAYIKSRTV